MTDDASCPATARSHVDAYVTVSRNGLDLVTEIASRAVCIDTVTENLHCPVAIAEE